MSLNERSWLGVGVKTGGILFVAGMESTEGAIMNVANTTRRANFSLLNARLGLGLGGGIGLTALCVFNCTNARQLHGQSNDDWGVNISLGERWDRVVGALRNYKFFATVAKLGTRLHVTSGEDLESIRNAMHYLYNAYDISSMSNTPKVIAIDTPISGGLEVSATYSFGGRIEIS